MHFFIYRNPILCIAVSVVLFLITATAVKVCRRHVLVITVLPLCYVAVMERPGN